ncbi:hypothetical protein DNTS_005147 [Danionella cerebrum]|uniref:BZIP domain-containing protein n=1 Tax=Danionella cerebrum TaxID=2873325 RepID=A0A553QEW6_9TELE|nr:hypothetical protein DNTS_005147 [Danionella translucida]
MPKNARVSAEQLLHTTAAEMETQKAGFLKDAGTDADAAAGFVPTVTAVASAPDLEWMVLSTDISSVSPCRKEKAQSSSQPSEAKHARKSFSSRRKGAKDQLSPEEEERKRIRRERNKLAAAKCRNRRRELTNSLQAETDSLEEDKAALQSEISSLLKEKQRLELLLSTHAPHCKLPEQPESQEQTQTQDEKIQAASVPEQVPSSPTTSTAIFGDSDVLLCSNVDLGGMESEPGMEMKEVEMEDLSSVIDSSEDMDLLVPDIDLCSSLGLSEWETLYMSMGGGLVPLSSPGCCPDSVPLISPASGPDSVPVFSFSSADEEKHRTGSDGKANTPKEMLMTL